jgi:hypothetical protein
MTESSGTITGDELKRIWKEVTMSLSEVVYQYLPGGNEENNEKLSTKKTGLRFELKILVDM